MTPADLSGRVVAITGASSGIGEATALVCAEAGAAVALGARREDRLRTLAMRIKNSGGEAAEFPADVGDESQAERFMTRAYERFGRLDALVNNAAIVFGGPIAGADTQQWREMVQTNVMGVLYCTHAALPLIRASGGGHVVNVTSLGGRRALAGSGIYSLTKHAVRGFSEALRQELAGQGIRVTVVCPGAVLTEMFTPVVGQVANIETIAPMSPYAVADAIVYALAQPAGVNVAELTVMPSNDSRGI